MLAEEMICGIFQLLISVFGGEGADVDAVVDFEESTKSLAADRLQVMHLP